MDPPSPLVEYHRTVAEFIEELSDLMESENTFHEIQYIENAHIVISELDQIVPMDGSEAMDLKMLRGLLMLCICQVQIDYDTPENYESLLEFKMMLTAERQEPEIIWLYAYSCYLLGEYFFDLKDKPQTALMHYVKAEENMAEYLMMNGNVEPFELRDIVETTMDDIFLTFGALRDSLIEKILFIGKMMNDQDVIFAYGVPGIRLMLQKNHDRRRDKFENFLETLACVAEVYIDHLYFRQAQHFIRFFEYLVQKYDKTWLDVDIDFFSHYHKKLFVMYVEQYLTAVRNHRQNYSLIKGNCNLIEEYFQDEETKLLGDHLAFIMDVSDDYIENLISFTHRILKEVKMVNHEIDRCGKELLGNAVSPIKNTQICDIKTKFMQNLSSCVNENQRFAWLLKMEIEARAIVESIDEETSDLYEEAALSTCAIGLLLVKDFSYDAHHASKCMSILDHCEMLAETYRLLPNGLTVFMLSKYLHATALMKSRSHEDLKIALVLLKEAALAYDEYQENSFGVEPKDLMELLGIHTDRFSHFQTVRAEVVFHRVRLASLKVALQLGDYELIQKTGLENIKSVFHLFDQNWIMMKPFLEIVLAFSYELLERNRLAQVNHLITCANKVTGSCPFREKAELEVLRLCYLHTLICQSIIAIKEDLEEIPEEEAYFESITEHEDIVRDDNLFPSKIIADCHDLKETVKKAIGIAEMFEKRKYNDNDIVALIKMHLIEIQEDILFA